MATEWTTDGLDHLLRVTDARIAALKNTAPLLHRIGKGMVELRRRRIDVEAGPAGPFAPLAKSTQMGFLHPATKSGRMLRGEQRGTLAFLRRGKSSRLLAGRKGFLGRAIVEAGAGLRGAKLDQSGQSAAYQLMAGRLGITMPQAARAMGERRGAGHILRRSGLLARSLAYRVEGDTVVVGSNRMAGEWNLLGLHQGGTAHMPARPVLGIEEEDRTLVGEAVEQFLAEVFGKKA